MKLNKLNKLITSSMSDSNAIQTTVLRSVKAKVIKMQTASKKSIRDLPENEMILRSLKAEMKELKEENEANMTVHNSALCMNLCAQMSYISPYIPIEVTEDETRIIVDEAISKVGTNMGKIMRYLKETGKDINMRLASNIVKELIL